MWVSNGRKINFSGPGDWAGTWQVKKRFFQVFGQERVDNGFGIARTASSYPTEVSRPMSAQPNENNPDRWYFVSAR